MNNKFKYSPLAIMIASALSISGCGGGDSALQSTSSNSALESTSSDSALESTSSNIIPTSNVVEANADTAHVRLAVKFPQADAAAAWVGNSTSIEVSFFNTKTVGSLAEANAAYDAQCQEHIEWQGFCYANSSDILRGQFATSVAMDTSSPSAYVDLLPGKYRIEAKFSNAQGKHQETSVSYVTLSKGEHSLRLRGLEATWTATEQLNLQLLNQASDYDWDKEVDGIQTAAQAMGITGAINGLHLPSVLTYPDGYLHTTEFDYNEGQAYDHAVLINAGVTSIEQLDREAQATAFQPVLRLDDGNNGEVNLLPRHLANKEDQFNEQGDHIGGAGSWNTTSLAKLQQEYSSAGDNALLSLGGYHFGHWDYDIETHTDNNHAVNLLVGVSELPEGASIAPQYTVEYRHENDETITIARIHSSTMHTDGDTGAYWQQLFVDLQPQANQVVDGSTISGYLIETETHYETVWGNEWSNTGVDTQPVSFLEAALVNIAENEGLMATGAADESCKTQAISGLAYSNDYRWDEAQQGWVAGTYNAFLADDEYGNNGLIAQIDNTIEEKTSERDSAQSELDASQAELDMYNAEIVAIVEAQVVAITTTISEIDAITTANSELIANYNTALAEYNSADDALYGDNGKYYIRETADNQVILYDAGLLPDCDTACYDLLIQERDTATAEQNTAWDLYVKKQALKDTFYINYQVVEQEVYDLIAPYDIYVPWGSSVFEVASAALQTRNNQLQTTLDEIASNSELTNADYNDNWELYNNRWNALWPVTYALADMASANDALAQLAQIKADALATADLNGDGEATIFEEGVYLATGYLGGWMNWDYSYDDTTGQQTQNYYLELNDFEIKETVKATSMSGEQTICVQPFTLKASQLSIEYDTAADIVIE